MSDAAKEARSPKGSWAIYRRDSGLVLRVVQATRRTAVRNLQPGEWLAPCSAGSFPSGFRVEGRQIVPGPPPAAPALDYAASRENYILEAWPIARQLEAMTEATLGRPEKLAALQAHIAAAKAAFPKPSA